MTWRPPYRDGAVHIAADRCSTCIFRPGNLMRLQPGRVKQMVEDTIAEQGAITCHKTLPYGSVDPPDGAICRGFYDGYADEVQALQVAGRLNVIVEVPVP
jgi:hypothetical protein